MPQPTSEADFAALVRRAGLPLTDAQRATIHAVWPAVQAMLEEIRKPAPGVAAGSAAAACAEPATTFSAEKA